MSPSSSHEDGFTLVELLIGLVIMVLVVGALSQVIISVSFNADRTVTRVTSSGSAFLTGARFAEDVGTSSAVGSTPPVSRAVAGCGGDPKALVRLLSVSGSAGVGIVMTSYSVTTDHVLERRTCVGSSVDDALAATPRVIAVVPDLALSPKPVTVECRATAGALAAPASVVGDAQCRLVAMTVVTKDRYSFTVRGLRSEGSSTGSAPVLRRCTLVVSDDANVYQDQPDRNFNDRDDYGESPGGRNFIEDRSRAGKIISGYFRFNLSGPCDGTASGEPAFMPPQRTLTSASLRLVFHDATQNLSNQKCTSQHNLDVLARAWDPATLTWNTSPVQQFPLDGLQPIRHGFTTQASWVDRPLTVNVLPEVRHWYPSPGGGDWANRGWVVSDMPNGCDEHESNKFMSKGSNNALTPRLVLSWTE